MKIPVEWLRQFVETPLGDTDLADRLTMAGLEVEEITPSDNGQVFHTKVIPNRGDWMSVVGSAREAAAALDLPHAWQASPSPDSANDIAEWASVLVTDSTLCPRYAGKVIRDITVGPSPEWIQRRLLASGMRPINNVVDIANYVMLELGQPLHTFDYDTLPEGKVIVRPANAGERIITLDGVERALEPGMLMICDRERPVCIAGVMGNAETEVSQDTRNLFIESAHFDPGSIRRTAKALGLSTEASYRFERYVDPALVPIALERISELLAEYAGGQLVPGRIDHYPVPAQPRAIALRPSRVNAILGMDLTEAAITRSLERLGLSVQSADTQLQVTVPTFRPDLVQEIDLVEEVGRMVGYETLPETIPSSGGQPGGDAPSGVFAQRLRVLLSGLGLQEAVTHSLAAPSAFDDPQKADLRVTIRQALSTELSGLRQTLLPNLLDILSHNLRQRENDVRLFEVGKVFNRSSDAIGYLEARSVAAVLTGALEPRSWHAERVPEIDFFAAKGILEALFTELHLRADFQPAQRHGMHPGRSASVVVGGQEIGYLAELDPDLARSSLELPASSGRISVFELNLDALLSLAVDQRRYVASARFPVLSRDLAVVVDGDVLYSAIENAARAAADPTLLAGLSLQSVYTGPGVAAGKKSIALRFNFRAADRTLTDGDVDTQLGQIQAKLAAAVGAEQR